MPDQSGRWIHSGKWGFPKDPLQSSKEFIPKNWFESSEEFSPNALLRGINARVEGHKQETGKTHGPIQFLQNFLSGGQLQAADETGSIGITPGGQLNLTGPQGSFNVDPRAQSAGFQFPVGNGQVGIQGSWNKYNPSAEVSFNFGNKPNRVANKQFDFSGLDQWESKPQEKTGALYNDPTPQEELERQLLEYRSSGGRSTNSPSSWGW